MLYLKEGSPFLIVRVSIKCNHIKEKTTLIAHCLSSSKVISDRVHCDPLSFVACGSSCHTVDFSTVSNDVPQGVDRTSLAAHCLSSSQVISDRVHCDPLSFVACGSSCHTADFSKESNDVHQGVHSPKCGYSHPNPHGSMSSPSHRQTPLFVLNAQQLLMSSNL